MAVPRLAEARPFFVLDPRVWPTRPQGLIHQRRVALGDHRRRRRPEPVDLVVCGSVAVGVDGARPGQGRGFSDLEFAVAAAAGLIGSHTLLVTTVHELQVRPAGEIPVADHDIRLDMIVTPERVIHVPRKKRPRPKLNWAELTDDKVASIPLLQRLRELRA